MASCWVDRSEAEPDLERAAGLVRTTSHTVAARSGRTLIPHALGKAQEDETHLRHGMVAKGRVGSSAWIGGAECAPPKRRRRGGPPGGPSGAAPSGPAPGVAHRAVRT